MDDLGSAGLYTGEAGFLGYYEICTRVQKQGWTKVFDEEQKCNYAYKGTEWVGYEDTYSLGFKVRVDKQMTIRELLSFSIDSICERHGFSRYYVLGT
jgi:chitinase